MKRSDIQLYIGNQSQIGGSRHYVFADGWARNMRCIDINSGNNIQFVV